ncbi:MAG: DivIVA domain-containing protein [Gaiellaceae bacterium]
MPDQSSAADEHAILQEITAPLSGLPDNPVPIAADVDFPIVLRGYDRIAVDAYVKRTSQLVAELQATHSPEAAVRRALERVGEQISGILQRAHDTAEEITKQSRSEAEDRLEVARQEAAKIAAEGLQRVKDLDADTDRIWAERLRILEDASELAAQLTAMVDDAATRFPPAEEAAQGLSQAELFDGQVAPAGVGEPADEADQAEPADEADDEIPEQREAETAVLGDSDQDPDATEVLPPVHPVKAPPPPASGEAPAEG